MDDRSAKINIGGREFELILTTRATKEIAGRYGGLGNLGRHRGRRSEERRVGEEWRSRWGPDH